MIMISVSVLIRQISLSLIGFSHTFLHEFAEVFGMPPDDAPSRLHDAWAHSQNTFTPWLESPES
jgi:hypothetical protein